MRYYRNSIWFADDGDYVLCESFEDGHWCEHSRLLIPGSYIEDAS